MPGYQYKINIESQVTKPQLAFCHKNLNFIYYFQFNLKFIWITLNTDLPCIFEFTLLLCWFLIVANYETASNFVPKYCFLAHSGSARHKLRRDDRGCRRRPIASDQTPLHQHQHRNKGSTARGGAVRILLAAQIEWQPAICRYNARANQPSELGRAWLTSCSQDVGRDGFCMMNFIIDLLIVRYACSRG